MRSKPSVAIGIDLGTSKCCVGVVRNGKVEILENERGNKTTPSYVAFTDTERLVGEDAKDQATLNSANTVSGVKRLLGRKFADPAVQELLSRLPYTLQRTELGKPFIELTYMKKMKKLYPEQVTAMLLTKMVDLVSKQLDCTVEEVVISVPASFSIAQRQATKDAAAIAGLKVLALINEPTAAAIAYQANRKEEGDEIIAVVDFGGGKFEVSFVLVGKEGVKVTAVYGCNRIGGLDVDSCLVELLINKFKHERNIDLKHNVKAKERLRNACEKLKHTLSLLPEARVQLDCLSGDFDFEATVTRNEFDQVFEKNITTIMNELRRRIEWLTVAKVLLVGGSTRIQVVQEWLKTTFESIKLDKTVNPDEAVAQGAAIWAAMRSGHCDLPEVNVCDIIPNSVFLKVDNTSEIIFQRFTPLPKNILLRLSVRSSMSKLSLLEMQSSLNGVRKLDLGGYLLRDKVLYSIEIDCLINKSGILVASLNLDGKKQSLDDVTLFALRLFDKKQLSELVIQEEQFKENAIAENQRVMALSELEAYCFQQKNSLETFAKQGKLSQSQQCYLEEQIEAAITWVDNNPDASEKVLNQMMLNFQGVCSSLSSNSKDRSSRSSSVGHHLKPASPSNGVTQERESRWDQSRAGHDVSKARAVSHSARHSQQGLSEVVPVVHDFRSTNGREVSSRDLERDAHTMRKSPQMIRSAEKHSASNIQPRGQSPQRSPRDPLRGETPAQIRRQSPHKQTSKRPHFREGSPARPPPPHSRGPSPQRQSGGCMTMQPQSPNSPQFRDTASHQPIDQAGLLPLSSSIIKEFRENQSKQNESNFPPIIKQHLLLTEGKLASSSRALSSSHQLGPDNKHPVQGVDTRASIITPASGSRSQSGDQDLGNSQSSSIPYQAILASVSRPYTQHTTDLITSLSGDLPGHATTTSNYNDPPSKYISVHDVNRSGPLRSTYLSSTNSSSATSRLMATEALTPTTPQESYTSLDHCNSCDERPGTRSIGVQTDPPNKEVNTRRPASSPTCEVCCQVFRCGCTPANGSRENLGSSVMKESNGEQKGYLPGSVHERSGSESRVAVTTVPPLQYSASSPYREGGSGRPTTSLVQTSAPSHYTVPSTVTSYYVTPKTPSHSSHNPSRNPSGRVNVSVSNMCSHGNRLESCTLCCAAIRSEQFREKVGARPMETGYAGVGKACKCGQVSCPSYHSHRNSSGNSVSPVRSGPIAVGQNVQELRRKFETAL